MKNTTSATMLLRLKSRRQRRLKIKGGRRTAQRRWCLGGLDAAAADDDMHAESRSNGSHATMKGQRRPPDRSAAPVAASGLSFCREI